MDSAAFFDRLLCPSKAKACLCKSLEEIFHSYLKLFVEFRVLSVITDKIAVLVRCKNTKKLVASGAIWYNYNVALGPFAAAQKMCERAAAKPSVLETQFLRWIKEM